MHAIPRAGHEKRTVHAFSRDGVPLVSFCKHPKKGRNPSGTLRAVPTLLGDLGRDQLHSFRLWGKFGRYEYDSTVGIALGQTENF